MPTRVIVDATDKLCPQPMLMAHNALSKLAPNDSIELFTTDPNCANDINAYCKYTNNILSSICTLGEHSNKYFFIITKQ